MSCSGAPAGELGMAGVDRLTGVARRLAADRLWMLIVGRLMGLIGRLMG